MPKIANRFPVALLVGYLILSIALAIHPHDRATWWAENIPIWMIVAALVATHRLFQFSNVNFSNYRKYA